MQLAGLLVAIGAAILSAVSAIIAWLGTHPRPTLTGKMTVAVPIGTQGAVDGTALLIHSIITNKVSSPVYVISYTLEVNYDNAWVTLHRAYDVSMPVLFVGDGTLQVTMTPECFIDREPQKVDFGSPLMGFLLFFHDSQLSEEGIREYRLTVGDVFGRRHAFTLSAEESRKFMSTKVVDQVGPSTVDIFRLSGAKIKQISKRSASH